jgi:hypothetical protein
LYCSWARHFPKEKTPAQSKNATAIFLLCK